MTRQSKKSDIPKAIQHISGLQRAPLFAPGVYFLVSRGDVVYVGQSISPTRRIGDHISEGIKSFDDVFVLDTPRPALDQVEAAFIALLKPKYNLLEGREIKATHSSERTVDVLRALAHGAGLTSQRKQEYKATEDQQKAPDQTSVDPNRLLKLPEVLRITGLSRTTHYKLCPEGQFPATVRLNGLRCVRWRASDIYQWVEAQGTPAKKGQAASQVKQLEAFN